MEEKIERLTMEKDIRPEYLETTLDSEGWGASYDPLVSVSRRILPHLQNIGYEKLEEIKKAVDPDFIAPDTALPDEGGEGASGYRAYIGLCARAVKTYQTLQKYQNKLDELKKLNALEEILGEDRIKCS